VHIGATEFRGKLSCELAGAATEIENQSVITTNFDDLNNVLDFTLFIAEQFLTNQRFRANDPLVKE
tara:strand:+ start:1237 stop:1434 length:198 start_codon:yes stop_codon:yes gene_type:complete